MKECSSRIRSYVTFTERSAIQRRLADWFFAKVPTQNCSKMGLGIFNEHSSSETEVFWRRTVRVWCCEINNGQRRRERKGISAAEIHNQKVKLTSRHALFPLWSTWPNIRAWKTAAPLQMSVSELRPEQLGASGPAGSWSGHSASCLAHVNSLSRSGTKDLLLTRRRPEFTPTSHPRLLLRPPAGSVGYVPRTDYTAAYRTGVATAVFRSLLIVWLLPPKKGMIVLNPLVEIILLQQKYCIIFSFSHSILLGNKQVKTRSIYKLKRLC